MNKMDVICIYENPRPTREEIIEEELIFIEHSIKDIRADTIALLNWWRSYFWYGTQEEYDNLQPDENTIYVIAED